MPANRFLRKRLHHAVVTLFAFCFVLLIAVGWSFLEENRESVLPAAADATSVRLVIDPGHGGEDGGAATADGTLTEKDVNLAVAIRVGDFADLLGFPTVLTRREDTLLYGLYNDLPDYTGKKKTYDLRNRLRLAGEYPDATFCSIHMNKFPSPECRGMQVYYSPHHEQSRRIAVLVQTYGKTYLQPDNKRQIKQATSAIYLLHRMENPAILVECGFLSSPADSSSLRDEGYLLRLSGVIAAALAESLPKT